MLLTNPVRGNAQSASPTWLVQIAVFALAYGLYSVSRFLAVGDASSALTHMSWVVDLERHLDIFREDAVQGALGHGITETALNAVYLLSQFAIVPLALVWTYRTNRRVYSELRGTVFVTWMLAVPIFMLFPTAPPRLGGIGLEGSVAALNSHLVTGLYNPYAAMPSLHCGFALAVSCAVLRAGSSRRSLVFGLLWAPLVCVSVVATGNHFLLDIVAGLALTVFGWRLATSSRLAASAAALARRLTPRAGRPAARRRSAPRGPLAHV